MLSLLHSPLHHAEAIDPTLIAWIREEIDHLVGLEPSVIVAVLGLAILAFPLWLGFSASRYRRRAEPDAAANAAADQRPS